MGAGRGASTHGRSAARSNSWARCSPSVGASASMPSVRPDAYGLPATTASRDALETYDRAVDGLLGWDAEALDRFSAAATTDPGLALAHAGLAICQFLDERFVEARESAERARTAAFTQTPRERGHVAAIALLVEGKAHDAEAAMTQHLADFPRDLVVFQRLYFVWFWQGKFGEMLDLSSVLARYYPGSSFMLGLHAFALEQAGRCDEALRIAQAAIGKNPRDAWSVHALAHALYELGAFDAGVTRLPPAIHPCTHLGWFRNHLLWHLILMHLGRGEYERASELGRTVFEREPSSIPGDLHDSISLLWRLELCGLPVKDRWRPFATIAAGRLTRARGRALTVVLAAALLAACVSLRAGDAGLVRITLLQINDVYVVGPVDGGHRGGLARLATLVRQARRENPNTVFVLAGDTLSPSVESRVLRGAQMVAALNAIGLDLATFGNHEFDFGPGVLRERIAESRFVWLSRSEE